MINNPNKQKTRNSVSDAYHLIDQQIDKLANYTYLFKTNFKHF